MAGLVAPVFNPLALKVGRGTQLAGASLVVDKIPKLLAGVDNLVGTRVMVGVPATEALRKPEPGEAGEPPNNAMLAYIHENGDAAGRIPPRPFLKPGVAGAHEAIDARLVQAANAAIDGKAQVVERALHAAGLTAQAAVRRRITTGPHLPLAPRTLAKRRARGRTGTKPLLDTGQLRSAINYVLRRIGSAIRRP